MWTIKNTDMSNMQNWLRIWWNKYCTITENYIKDVKVGNIHNYYNNKCHIKYETFIIFMIYITGKIVGNIHWNGDWLFLVVEEYMEIMHYFLILFMFTKYAVFVCFFIRKM